MKIVKINYFKFWLLFFKTKNIKILTILGLIINIDNQANATVARW